MTSVKPEGHFHQDAKDHKNLTRLENNALVNKSGLVKYVLYTLK